MANLSEDSLFSLEVVVDSLNLSALRNVPCRFPAVAFRLLDFPTLLICGVEPELGDTIKDKVSRDPHYNLPHQLPELQDRHGNYILKKGKSCLFKVAANTLRSHLSSTPMYVMLIDTYPDTPKLIGSCNIGLDEIMDKLYNDICKNGLSTPAVSGEKGDYPFCNLMGKTVGMISLGFRLLSLGVGLIPHIPDTAIAKTRAEPVTSSDKVINITTQNFKMLGQPIQVSILPDQPKQLSCTEIQTHKENQSASTQTQNAVKKNYKKLQKQCINAEADELLLLDNICPPPLYFNSENEQQSGQSLVLSHYPSGLQNEHLEIESELSDEGTIREEDRYSDSEHTPDEIRRMVHKDRKEEGRTHSMGKIVYLNKEPALPSNKELLDNLTNFPIINALMQEVLAMQQKTMQGLKEADRTVITHSTDKAPDQLQSQKLSARRVASQESHNEVLARLATPRKVRDQLRKNEQPQYPGTPVSARKHETCAQQDINVPKNKSWLRKEPVYGVKKTKLTTGMTNTQRLRLAKTNPKLLETLEKEEQTRIQKRRERTAHKWGSTRVLTPGQLVDVSTEVSHHHVEEGIRPGELELNLHGLELGDSLEQDHKQKKPVPTPRLSVSGQDVHSHLEVSSHEQKPPFSKRGRKDKRLDSGMHTDNRVVNEPTNPDIDQYSSRSKSVEVHVPTGAMYIEDAASAKTSSDGSLLEADQPADDFGKTQVIHRFPPSSHDYPVVEEEQYSDDFEVTQDDGHGEVNEGDMLGESPELRCIIDKYSDQEGDVSDRDGHEPDLRRIVDHYSSDDEGNSQQSATDQSYHSVRSTVLSNRSHQAASGPEKASTVAGGGVGKLPVLPNPSASSISPVKAVKLPQLPVRQPFRPSSSRGRSADTSLSPDSTAYIRQSQIPSQLSQGEESSSEEAIHDTVTRQRDRAQRPQPSPRTRRREISVNTESLSSYAPSEAGTGSPVSPTSPGYGREYSESFESDSHEDYLPVAKSAQEAKLFPEARLGYTWGL